MATQSQIDERGAAPERMPRALRYALFGSVAALVAGALYLIAVRGQALLVDLQALGRIFCI